MTEIIVLHSFVKTKGKNPVNYAHPVCEKKNEKFS